MRTEPARGAVPGVEGGVLLGFPCPGCGGWARPLYEPACGHYACQLCGSHTDPLLLNDAYTATRQLMPDDLRYEQEPQPPTP